MTKPGETTAAPSRAADRTRTGLLHALGPVLVMFAGPITIDVCAAVRPSYAVSLWLDTVVTAVSTLAGFAWLITLAARRPMPVISRQWEITCYGAGAVACCVALLSDNRLLTYIPLFELLRALMAIALVIRLARLRGTHLAPGGRWRRWRVPRGWCTSACVMAAGIAVSAWAMLVIPDWVGVAPTSATSQVGAFGDWLVVALSGTVEELVAMAGVVTALEWARSPAWLIYAVTIIVRMSYHVHLGVPTVLAVAFFAAASTWAFRRWRMVTPLAITHTAYNAVLTVLSV